ncbi:MAG TPA: tRNA lysidine(34) synthetase TilS [Steroidobacteraceae bacterium]|nr:tRNA lysidine(34) synthetase TilS [Steroidobacteraceae bacterium]
MSGRRPARPDAASELLSPPKRFDSAWLRGQLRSLIGTLRARSLCLAYSGGLDSCALLCALASLRKREGFVLRALHVNHQLQPLAARWARQAQSNARRLRVPCEILTVRVNRGRGESLEAAARTARYQALLSRLKPDELLLTAHHQEDQFETVLLALMRGSGVRGLSAMNPVTPLAHTRLLRPLLPVARAQLERYLKRRAVGWSEDPSNTDERFDRNYLRHVVVPLLRARWPAAAATAARSAAHLSQTRAMLERLGLAHLKNARDGQALRVSVLRRLPQAERINALRVWLAERALPMPDYDRMREIAGPMLSARPDAMPAVSWQGAQLRRHADRLLAYRARETHLPAAAGIEVERWSWRTQPWVSLGSAGSLGLVRDRHGDVRLAALPSVLSVRYRRGGERLAGTQGRFALKDLLQRKGLAPWVREQVPLVMHDRTVVAVADLWLCPQFAAHSGSSSGRARFRWRHPGVD